MNDFLEFLNKAPEEELKAIPGFSPDQVQAVIAARPLSSVEDLSRGKELSAEVVAKLQAAYEEMNTAAPVTDQADSPKLEVEKSSSSNGNKISQILLRVLIALLIVATLFAAVYFGVPLFKEKILNPLQNNTARVSEIATQQAADVQQLSDQIAALTKRVSTLEARADAVDGSLKTHSETLSSLKDMQTKLQANLDDQNKALLGELDQQLTLTRAIEYLSRSRLYLSQSNYGLARADAASARDLLYSLLATLPADQVDSMKIVIARVDTALTNLPAYPVIAVYDIDTAWQLLVDSLPNVPQSALTPVISGTQPGALPEPTLEVTPTP